MLLWVHEAVCNKNIIITLLLEYLARKHGIVVDFVVSMHHTTDGKRVSQTIYVSEHVKYL